MQRQRPVLRRGAAGAALLMLLGAIGCSVHMPSTEQLVVADDARPSGRDARDRDAVPRADRLDAGSERRQDAPKGPTITGPSPATRGTTVTISWANIDAPWWNDYLILCPAGAANGGACVQETRLYADSCSAQYVNSGHGTATGSCANFEIPASLSPGTYEYRYYRYDSWTDLQATQTVMVI